MTPARPGSVASTTTHVQSGELALVDRMVRMRHLIAGLTQELDSLRRQHARVRRDNARLRREVAELRHGSPATAATETT